MTNLNATPAPGPLRIPEFSVAERLRKAREDADLTQMQLAELTGIGVRTIIKYENGRQPVKSRGHYVLWEWATRVPAEWLETGQWGNGNGPGPKTVTSDYIAPIRVLKPHPYTNVPLVAVALVA